MRFRKAFGTRERWNILTQRNLDTNQDVLEGFVDFEKAFDKVKHEKLKNSL